MPTTSPGAHHHPQIVSAVAVATNRVRVTLSEPPAESGLGSAWILGNWIVTKGIDRLEVVEVAPSGSRMQEWTLTVYPSFAGGASYAAGATASLKTTGGLNYLEPATMPFQGVRAREIRPAVKRAAGLDFSLRTFGAAKTRAGCYSITASGDYALSSQGEALESNVLRRLQTPRGRFTWAPTYGVGLTPKRLLSTTHLLAAKREMETQLTKESSIRAVAPRLAKVGGSLLLVQITIQTKDGNRDVTYKMEG